MRKIKEGRESGVCTWVLQRYSGQRNLVEKVTLEPRPEGDEGVR